MLTLTQGAAYLLAEAELNPIDILNYHLRDSSSNTTGYQLREAKAIISQGRGAVSMRANVRVDGTLGSRIQMKPGSQVVITPGVISAITEREANRHADLLNYLLRHLGGDWGDAPDEDKELNDRDSAAGEGALSEYKLPDGERIWVSTEWDRSVTTILLPDEY